MPQVSVLMPVRDGAPWIGASIDSVLGQTFADLELIIVDDGSTDATPDIVADHAARDRRVLVIRQPPSGLVTTLNAGLDAARAPLLARLDADDVAEPTRIAEQVSAMSGDPQLVLLGSWASEIDESGARCGARHPDANAAPLLRETGSANPMIHSTIILRTEMARQLGGYRHAFIAAEDFDLWLRLSERGKVANLERELVRYRIHPGSVSAQKALAQMFSTRLAQRSALLRRSGEDDPADGARRPFDLWADCPAAYADDFSVYRLLAWSNPDDMPSAFRAQAPDFSRLRQSELTRRERRVAQQAILRYLAERRDHMRFDLWRQMLTLRPARAIPLVWQHLTRRDDKRI